MKPTRAVTFLFTDIVDAACIDNRMSPTESTSERVGEVIAEVVIRNHGFVYRTSGYRYCCAFVLPLDAVVAANQIQSRLGSGNCADVEPVLFRMAVHTGEAKEADGHYSGATINRVLQLLTIARPGQIIASSSVETLVTEFLPEDLQFEEVPVQPRETPRRERVLQLQSHLAGQPYSYPLRYTAKPMETREGFKVAFRQPRAPAVYARRRGSRGALPVGIPAH